MVANQLLAALQDISRRFSNQGRKLTHKLLKMPQIPEQVLIPREAFYRRKIKTSFDDSIGKVCGELVMAYPPGIPIIIPGERITKEILDYVKDMKAAKLQLQGMEDPELTTINIIEES